MNTETLVVVGGGLAGAKAVEGARDGGFEGRIVLVAEEQHLPYERPPLSKAVLRGEKEPNSTEVGGQEFIDKHQVDMITGTAVASVDLAGRRLRLDRGSDPELAFDALVLATGATPRKLDIAGASLDGVHYLRTVDDSLRLSRAIRDGGRVAVIGGGWIGTEVAASARQLGADVVMIDPAPVPLQRVLGAEMGEVFRRLHVDQGVTVRSGIGVSELRGSEKVEEVVLSDGSVEPATTVVVGIGVEPATALGEAAGLKVDNGVVVDERLETSAPRVYAAGDVANAFHPHYREHIRVEHWSNALNQGSTAGRNAAGAGEIYDRLPYFFTDQYDLGMEYVGFGSGEDEVLTRGDVDSREFIAWWLREGKVTAAMNVNIWDVVDDLRAVVASRRTVDRSRLADPNVPLNELVK